MARDLVRMYRRTTVRKTEQVIYLIWDYFLSEIWVNCVVKNGEIE